MKKSHLKKVALLFILGILLIFIEACCTCAPAKLEFFEFQSIKLELNQDVISSSNMESLEMEVILEGIEFVAQRELDIENKTCSPPWFINSAFACSCIEEGDSGLKNPVTSIRVFSDSDYSDEIVAGETLNDIVKVKFLRHDERLLPEVVQANSLFSAFENMILSIDTPPTVDSTHILTVEIVRDNGVTITIDTETVTWL